jgi:uncharacterized protein YyaL (SSP411 family)
VIAWGEWRPEAFAQARALGAPVLLLLPSGKSHAELEAAFAGLDGLVERCVTVCADRCDRPDIHARYGPDAAVCLLSHSGRLLEKCGLAGIGEALGAWIDRYEPAEPAKPPEGAAWTGAVGPERDRALPEGRPRAVLGEVLAHEGRLSPAGVELLIYAASDWADAAARGRLETELESVAARTQAGMRTLGGYAAASRLLWDGFAVLERPRLREAASNATARMIRELYDSEKRAFRHTVSPASEFFADENAQAALALQRAGSFEPGMRFAKTADEVLAFLRGTAFDPLLGMVHRRRDAGTLVYGLLGDNAWSILAFTEAFLMTGHKPHREFADGLAKFLFQELWDRDTGAFLDRVGQRDDVGLLAETRRGHPEENGVALEGLWRLHHLKGNTNYKRWLEWGLASLTVERGARAARLARVQDMLAAGRLDLELVGRPGEPQAEELLAALNRHHAPRRIVSFVDPDDQDYILAHRLELDRPPVLFGCVDLKPVADARTPAAVGDVLKALSQARHRPAMD